MMARKLDTGGDLASLLDGLADAPQMPVGGISDDSRRLRRGDVFLACQGATQHGLEFVDAAIAAGVAAIVWDESTGDAALARGAVPFIAVPDLGRRLGEIANRWYDWPSRDLEVVGVTGTNGKTTVAFLVAQSTRLLGRTTGYIGTLGHGIDRLAPGPGMTTPPCLEIHARLAEFRAAGATAAAIEVSSHALAQERLDGVAIDTAIFTNLSRDHIDYHGDMAAYAASKARLFTDFDAAYRIVNVDCAVGRDLARRLGRDVIVTSLGSEAIDHPAFVVVRSAAATESGSRIVVDSSWGGGEIHVPVPGAFNVANAIQVLASLLAHGVDFVTCAQTIAALQAPPGRLQRVNAVRETALPAVYVDYAHTPAALEAVLKALRPHAAGRIWCVFGCGGDRDRGKRPEMGRVASRLADRVVITSDNPRTESPEAIISDIEAGTTTRNVIIEDRRAAIDHAVSEADPADTVLIAGKGHEDYQIVGDRRLQFSDFEVARACLDARRAGGAGR